MASEPSDYDRGLAFGQMVKADHDAGGSYDPRWDIADEAKGSGDFKAFMRGLNDAFKEEAQ